MISVNEALKLLNSNINPFKIEEVKPLQNAVGTILFKDMYSPINMPPFRQSAMDGYALFLHDSHTYSLIGEIKAGDNHQLKLKTGEAVRIFTGAPVPETANAVIMQEKVTVKDLQITLEKNVSENDNIRQLGEQVKKGAIALKKGATLTPAAIGFLLSLGITEVPVYKKPSIALLATGNELVEAGKSLQYGEIYESNSGMLLSALNTLGYKHSSIYKIEDDYAKTLSVLKKVISENDFIIITGGISVGDYDFVGKALQELTVEEIFYKVKQKPGKPLFFGKKDDTIIFALPGNPAAALSCFYIYVYPCLEKLSGNIEFSLTNISAISNSSYFKKGDRAQFLKAIYKEGRVTILEGQSSAMMQTFSVANALVFMPEALKKILKEDPVQVICLPN